MGVGDQPAIEHRHQIIVGTVQDGERSRRELIGALHRLHIIERLGPYIEVLGERVVADHSDASSVSEQVLRIARPVREVSRWSERRHRTHIRFDRSRGSSSRARRRPAAQQYGRQVCGGISLLDQRPTLDWESRGTSRSRANLRPDGARVMPDARAG